jgi:hypothetical protein
MEKQVKKPDWTEVIAMADLFDYFKTAKSENDLNELFDRELLKYKSEVNRFETPEFIDIQIEKIKGMIEKVKTVKDYTKFIEYRNAIFYLKFLHTKQTEQPNIKPTAPEPIIEKAYLSYIHKRFEKWINEPLELWIERFVYPSETPVNPMNIDSKVKGTNDRLIMYAILAEIYKCPHPDFVYEDFVFDRFGIKNFHKAISTHKDKPEYKTNSMTCRQILKD